MMAENEVISKCSPPGKVRLLASTGDITQTSNTTSSLEQIRELNDYLETAQWTADGTTLLTTSSSNTICGYVVPEDLLTPHTEPLFLTHQTKIHLPERSNVLAPAPYFSLSEPYTNQLLISPQDHPIQLYYLFPPPSPSSDDDTEPAPHKPASSYPFLKARSETFETASSLIWPRQGSHFIAGCKNLLAKFDVTRTGEEPVLRVKTIPSERHLSKGGGVGMRGTVSTLSTQAPDEYGGGLVAAGTWTRWVGLYDFGQSGDCVSTWSIASAVSETGRGGDAMGGDGIMQTIWSPCGRYLLVSERRSKGILVYDVRVNGKMLGWLMGREASSNQRIYGDVFPGQEGTGGFEVWSGTTDGTVKMWEGVGSRDGAHEPAGDWKGHNSNVGSTCLHQSGSVLATCSGSWEFSGDEGSVSKQVDEDESDGSANDTLEPWMYRRSKESFLKIWGLGSSGDEDFTDRPEHSEDV